MKYEIPGISKEETIGYIEKYKNGNNYTAWYLKRGKKNLFWEWEFPFARIKEIYRKQVIKYVESIFDSFKKMFKYAVLAILSSMITAVITSLIFKNVINVGNPIIQMILALVPAHTTFFTVWNLFQEIKELRDKYKYSIILEVDQILTEISFNDNEIEEHKEIIEEVTSRYGIAGDSNDSASLQNYKKLRDYLLQLQKANERKDNPKVKQLTHTIYKSFI